MAGREDYFADLQQIVDRILMHPDPVHQVNSLHQLLKDARKVIGDARGEAIYRLLQTMSQADAQRVTGIDRAVLSVLCNRWRNRKGYPRLRAKRRRVDLSGGIDLSGGSSQSPS